MSIPHEFTPESIATASKGVRTPYADFWQSGEPYRSILDANPWLTPPKPNEPLEWGKGHYYDTTIGRKHPYWKQIELPQPTKKLNQLRADLQEWGYCLIEDGLSSEQTAVMRTRIDEQAAGEREAGIAYMTSAFQIVWTLVNKGECFVKALEHDQSAVQAGPVIEQLLNESLGFNWYNLSFVSNIAFPKCQAQGLHQDSLVSPWQTTEAPTLVNTMYILQDVDEINGGTLIIPTSHRLLSEAGSGKPVGKLPPAINVEAAAGTVMVFDGRLLHGTGANRTDKWRYVMTQANVKPWIRQQENWMLAVRPDILENASPKLLQRMGFQATAGYGLTEGYGTFGSGVAGDTKGALVKVRQAVDNGTYRRVGELTPEIVKRFNDEHFTLQEWQGTGGEERSATHEHKLQSN